MTVEDVDAAVGWLRWAVIVTPVALLAIGAAVTLVYVAADAIRARRRARPPAGGRTSKDR